MNSGNQPCNLGEYEVIKETAKAILVSDGDDQLWVPKSVIHDNSEIWKTGQSGNLVVETWFAENEGLY